MPGSRVSWPWLLLLGASACSLTQSLEGYEGASGDLDAGDAAHDDAAPSCLNGTKSCGGACVPVADPAYGCQTAGCTPCEAQTNTLAACGAAGCVSAGCAPQFADCDGIATNGCETTLGTEAACGRCDERCADAGDNVSCNPQTLRCEITSCPAGTGDCNSDVSDGCESALDGSPDCGACGVICPASFSCTPGPKQTCACSGDESCDAGGAGGCVQGLCVCGTSLCSAGQRCVAAGSCG